MLSVRQLSFSPSTLSLPERGAGAACTHSGNGLLGDGGDLEDGPDGGDHASDETGCDNDRERWRAAAGVAPLLPHWARSSPLRASSSKVRLPGATRGLEDRPLVLFARAREPAADDSSAAEHKPRVVTPDEQECHKEGAQARQQAHSPPLRGQNQSGCDGAAGGGRGGRLPDRGQREAAAATGVRNPRTLDGGLEVGEDEDPADALYRPPRRTSTLFPTSDAGVPNATDASTSG